MNFMADIENTASDTLLSGTSSDDLCLEPGRRQ